MNAEPIDGEDPELRSALVGAGLPVDDLAEPGRQFFRLIEGERTVGFGGFELHDGDALLRSLVIVPETRGTGRGRAATELLMRHAAAAGARNAYLLTTEATAFFEQAGFRALERALAPAAILATRQAAALCPSTAALMTRPIRGAHDG